MSRRRRAVKRPLRLDSKYHSTLVSRLVNTVMIQGRKTTAERIVYRAFDEILEKVPAANPLDILQRAVDNAKPRLEVKGRRVGGATYQVPVEVKSKRAQALALRWIMEATRKRKNKTMAEKLYAEILDASQNKGSAIKKREDTHKMAEANKAFAHFRW